MKIKWNLSIVVVTMILMISPTVVKAECEHDWSNWEYVSGYSCTVGGKKEHQCLICGEIETIIVPKSQHQWCEWETEIDASCDEKGEKYRYCYKCGQEENAFIPKTPHDWDEWECIREATGFQTGKYQRECFNCETIQNKTTPILSTVKTKNKSGKEIKKSVAQFWNAAQKYDIEKMKKCFVKKTNSFFERKKYTRNFIRKSNKKNLKYVITSIKQKGTKATVKVSCKYQNCYDIFFRSLNDTVNYMMKTGDTRELTVDKYQCERIKKYDKKYKKKYSYKTLTLKMKKVGKKWKIISFNSGINDVIHCNYNKAYKNYFGD